MHAATARAHGSRIVCPPARNNKCHLINKARIVIFSLQHIGRGVHVAIKPGPVAAKWCTFLTVGRY